MICAIVVVIQEANDITSAFCIIVVIQEFVRVVRQRITIKAYSIVMKCVRMGTTHSYLLTLINKPCYQLISNCCFPCNLLSAQMHFYSVVDNNLQ